MNNAATHAATGRRTLLGATTLTIAALALVACAQPVPQAAVQMTAPQPVGAWLHQGAAAAAPGLHAFVFTGAAQSLVVPEGVLAAQLTVTGAGGGQTGKWDDGTAGRGMKMIGKVSVSTGDTLTIGVGGQGGAANGDQTPGAAGWALSSHWAGGQGGHGHGKGYEDGAGGGGASVVLVNNKLVVIAAGGGGVGGRQNSVVRTLNGGDGGDTIGQDGEFDSMEVADPGGHGGSNIRSAADPNGGSFPGPSPKGGGGGGGGGAYQGEGGTASFWGGTGGGGGTSFRAGIEAQGWTNVTGAANGSVNVLWITDSNGIKPSIDLNTHGSIIGPNLARTPFTVTLPDDATGAITFIDTAAGSSTELATVQLARGVATLSQIDLPLTLGAHDISAVYSGDNLYRSGESNHVAVTVAKMTAPVVVKVGYANGVAVADGAHLAPLEADLPADATGTVTFTYTSYTDASNNGTLATAVVHSGIAAAAQLSRILPKGNYTINAEYSGDMNYATAEQGRAVGVFK